MEKCWTLIGETISRIYFSTFPEGELDARVENVKKFKYHE